MSLTAARDIANVALNAASGTIAQAKASGGNTTQAEQTLQQANRQLNPDCAASSGNNVRNPTPGCNPNELRIKQFSSTCPNDATRNKIECQPMCNDDEIYDDTIKICTDNDKRYYRKPNTVKPVENIKLFGSKSDINLANIKTIENKKVLFIVYDLLRKDQINVLNNNTFTTDGKYNSESPSGLLFRDTIKYKADDWSNLRNYFAFKIYGYITIPTNGSNNYTFILPSRLNGQCKLFINNYLIIDNTRTSFTTYLTTGTYLLYVERTHDKTITSYTDDLNNIHIKLEIQKLLSN